MAALDRWTRPGRIFTVVVFLGVMPTQSKAAEACDDVKVRVDIAGEIIRVDVETAIAAPAMEVWTVLTDFERLPQFVSNLLSSKVLSRDGNVVRVSQSGKVSFGPFSFKFQSEREISLTPFVKIDSRMISGNMKHFRGVTHIDAIEGATRIRYQSEGIPDTVLPLSFGRSLVQSETREHYTEICKEVMRRRDVAAGG